MMNVKSSVRRLPVYVVVPPRALMLDIAGPLEVLCRANREQANTFFEVKYVGPAESVSTSIGLRLTSLQPLPQKLPSNAIVIVSGNSSLVPGMDNAGSRADADRNGESSLIAWLRSMIRPEHMLVTICSGAMFAAKAGLLHGRACTTHHLDCADLQRIAPTAKVMTDRLYVQDGNVFTCAGVTSGVDLALHLVSRLIGRECTLAIARYLVVYLRRSGNDPQLSPWLEGRNHLHPVIHRVQDAIADDPARRWTRTQLARLSGASGRHLSRLFLEHVGVPMVEYRNRLRVALARELISQSQLDMEQVAERVGFGSTRQLRRAWAQIYPTTPRQARLHEAAVVPLRNTRIALRPKCEKPQAHDAESRPVIGTRLVVNELERAPRA